MKNSSNYYNREKKIETDTVTYLMASVTVWLPDRHKL